MIFYQKKTNVTHVVDVGDTEGEAWRNADAKSQLALFPVLADRDTRAGLSEELAEGNGDRGLLGVEDVVGRPGRASSTDDTNARARRECQYASNVEDDMRDRVAHVESGGSSSGNLNAELGRGCSESSRGEGEDGGDGGEHGD